VWGPLALSNGGPKPVPGELHRYLNDTSGISAVAGGGCDDYGTAERGFVPASRCHLRPGPNHEHTMRVPISSSRRLCETWVLSNHGDIPILLKKATKTLQVLRAEDGDHWYHIYGLPTTYTGRPEALSP
jgi:hypothetical protein